MPRRAQLRVSRLKGTQPFNGETLEAGVHLLGRQAGLGVVPPDENPDQAVDQKGHHHVEPDSVVDVQAAAQVGRQQVGQHSVAGAVQDVLHGDVVVALFRDQLDQRHMQQGAGPTDAPVGRWVDVTPFSSVNLNDPGRIFSSERSAGCASGGAACVRPIVGA